MFDFSVSRWLGVAPSPLRHPVRLCFLFRSFGLSALRRANYGQGRRAE